MIYFQIPIGNENGIVDTTTQHIWMLIELSSWQTVWYEIISEQILKYDKPQDFYIQARGMPLEISHFIHLL